MDPDTAAAFQRLREADPSNRRCLECDSPEPQWCALSYGAFVCLHCSGLHRGLGVHLSFVRSSTMDAWQPQQLKLMECGGNAKCKNFFVEYGVWDMPLKERYATKAAAYYRALLRSAAEPSVAAPPPLDRAAAAEPDAGAAASPPYSTLSSIRSLGSRPLDQQQQQQEGSKEEDGLFASLQQQAAAASAAAAAAAATVSSTGGAAIDTALQSVSSFVSGAKEYTTKTIEAAGESGIIEKAKGGFQTGSEWIAQQSKKLSTTFRERVDCAAVEETLHNIQCGNPSAAAAAAAVAAAAAAAGASAGGEGNDSSSPSSSPDGEQQQQQQQQGDEPQRGSSGVLQSMRELTRRSISNVTQVVRSSSSNSNSSGAAEGGSVLDKARESLSSLTAVAAGWLQPAEVPPPACGAPDGEGAADGGGDKFL
ncbi:ARF1-directed GTPase-activating protein, putative [Eimeria mitis]|uniref:ARF1-directed GTPase-activating protein, putative n=1 Tax=Eimeria mitis TaxID=44415 RepID=U6K2F1_9EIME|nr:ARF1-directed GTPase-activating protein, putative [Eimeria mitis]CDJ31176.1 ARF1-directed GTPase-activating protein, putative [Eimeria mitis]